MTAIQEVLSLVQSIKPTNYGVSKMSLIRSTLAFNNRNVRLGETLIFRVSDGTHQAYMVHHMDEMDVNGRLVLLVGVAPEVYFELQDNYTEVWEEADYKNMPESSWTFPV